MPSCWPGRGAVLALPAVETKLTVNGSSQIVRRLNHLGQKGMGVWNWRDSVAGFWPDGGVIPDDRRLRFFKNQSGRFNSFDAG